MTVVLSAVCQPYYFRNYQVENGLSNNTVFSCVQDQQGFVWMGSKDGLNRFDGYTFKVFRNNPVDSTSIGDNFIRSLFIDTENNLYAGTRIGLYKYNALLENFRLVYKTTQEIRDIEKDSIGNLWFVAGQTLIRLHETSKVAQQYNPERYFAATSVCLDSTKTIWVSTANGTLQQYDDQKNNFTSYNLFTASQTSSAKWIEKIQATPFGTILVGTSNYGIKQFHLANFTTKDLLTFNPDKTEIFARDFVQYAAHEIWIATESGIFIYNTGTRQYSNLKKQFNNPYSISDNAVYSLTRDKEGGMWAGTYFGGINYYPKQYSLFEKYFPDYSSTSISGNAVREICEDKFGNLWIGTEDAGLNKLNKTTGQFTQYKPTGNSSGISYPNIHGLLVRNNQLWIGTFEHGLNILDIATGKVIKQYPESNNPGVLKSNFIVTLLQTKNGTTYAGTRQGIYLFDEKTNSFRNSTAVPENSFVHSLMEDRNSILWIGTMGNGLFYYDEQTGKTGNFVHRSNNKKGIPNNSVTTIFEDSEGTLWIGTEGAGLCKFNRTDSSFTEYPSTDGLPANTVYKILEDRRKNLWITTSKGLVCFNLKTNKQTIYTTANGLLSDQFNYNSGYKDSSGRMYFGCVKGLISFNPETFIPNTFIPPLFITAINVNNKELPINSQSPLQQSILQTKRITLSHQQSSFSIDFAALSFTAPEMSEYQYMMQGLDNNWTYLKTNRKVYFTNLTAGTYVFRVKASNSSGKWNEQETKIIIKITPPLWASTAAYILYAFLISLLAVYIFTNYHERIAEKNRRQIEYLEHEKEKEIYQSKIDFFTNIAHEIRTPLTLIKAPLEKVVEKAGNNHEFGIHLKIMETNTERLIDLTNQLLDFRKIETNHIQLNFVRVSINELLQERTTSFKPIAEQKKIKLHIQFPPTPVYAFVDIDSMHKILNNLFYNALSYGKRKATVKLFQTGDSNTGNFTIEFSNDGYLVPAEMKEKIFDPFYRLKETSLKPGSGIGLALSRSLAQLQNGELYFREHDKGMNVFVLRLPLNQNSVNPKTEN